MSILVVTDTTWDNIPIIKKRLKSLEQNNIINAFYTKQLNIIEKYCSENMLYIFRRSLDPKNKEQSILNILNNINFVIIFTNFIEYNTISSFLIEACRINKISNFIFTEYNTGFIFNEVYFEDKFKTCIKNISKREPTLIIKPEMYIENYIQTNPSINGTIEKLREKYSNININKRDKRIKFLFDKDEQRLEKKHRKTAKEIAYHNYELKRNAWIKDIIPRH